MDKERDRQTNTAADRATPESDLIRLGAPSLPCMQQPSHSYMYMATK